MGGFTMDKAFEQAPEHRPKPTAIVEATGIPVIDLSPLLNVSSGEDDEAAAGVDAVAAEVGAACRDWGFFVVVGHGVPLEVVARATEVQRAFFALPAERKAAVRRSEESPLPIGYYESEHTKNVRDWKEVFDFAPHEMPPEAAADGELVFSNRWPDLPGFREAMEEYARAMEELAFKLLQLIARSLNLGPDRLHGFFKDHQMTFVRLNHYPPCPNPDLALGVGRHKDSGALTILLQDDVGGLDVRRRRSDDEWVRVKPVPDSFVINLGDITQVWSNDAYESPEHRAAVNSDKDRFSIGYFFNPAAHTMVEPLEELLSDENPARYNPYNIGDFYNIRSHSNFKKLDVENLQIAHFRKSLV